MVEGSRRVSAQTGHMSVWDMLWHTEQYLIPLRIFIIASPKATDVATSSRKRWRARRKAVLRPIPGRRDISDTALSRSDDSNSCVIRS